MSDLATLDHRHLWHPFTQHGVWDEHDPLIVDHAEGCTLVDVHGNRYLDGVSSLWTNVHGHRHPKIDAAIRGQLDRVAHSTFLGLTHEPAIRLAEALVKRAPAGLSRVFYSDNGSTAAEVAVKMAFQAQQQAGQPDRTLFATLSGAYHGDTLGAVSVGAIELFHQLFRPLLFRTIALPAPVEAGGDEEAAALQSALALLDQHGSQLAAFVFEPLVQGAAGMKRHSPAFVRTLIERARAHGAYVIADEVATGFGRTGTLFAMEQVGVSPDFLCLAKGISGGYLPLAATLTTESVFRAFLGRPETYRQFFHGHTYTANPLACAAGLASLALFDEEHTLDRVRDNAALLATRLDRMRTLPGVGAIRQCGLMVGIDLRHGDGTPFPVDRTIGYRVAMAARPRGAILRPLGDTLVLNPPLSITPDELLRLADIAEAAIASVLEETR